MFSFRRVAFDNGATIFLRPADHDRQIGTILDLIATRQLIITDTTVERAAAWNTAVNLYHLPVEGTA